MAFLRKGKPVPNDHPMVIHFLAAWRYAKTNRDPISKRRWRRIRGRVAALDPHPELIRAHTYTPRKARFYRYILMSKLA